MDTVLNWVVQYGLGNFLAVAIVFGAWRILIFVFQENSKREDRLASIIEKNLNSLEESIKNTNELVRLHENREIQAMKGISEANAYQRAEHKDMITVLRDLKDEIMRLSSK